MTTTTAEQMTTDELLKVVLKDEQDNQCSDRNKLNMINMIVRKRTMKTVSTLLTEKGW